VSRVTVLLLYRLLRVVVCFFFVIVLGFICRLTNEVRGVKKGTLFGAYVDEGGLDAREDGIYATEINVTDHASVVWTIDEELYELPVLQNRDPRFARSRVNEDFSFHCRRLTPARRLGEQRG
jgi:hypothetical protein